MDIKDIYKAKNNTPKEIYRTFISLYYFLLFNDRIKFIEKKEETEIWVLCIPHGRLF